MCLVKNLPILTRDKGRKSEKIKQERGLRLFYLLDNNGGRLSRLTTFLYWNRRRPRYWWNHINGERGCCWLFWIIIVVSVSEFSKVLDYQCRFLGILFFRVAFSQNQVVEPWQLTCCWLFSIDCIVSNTINLVLLIIAGFKLEI